MITLPKGDLQEAIKWVNSKIRFNYTPQQVLRHEKLQVGDLVAVRVGVDNVVEERYIIIGFSDYFWKGMCAPKAQVVAVSPQTSTAGTPLGVIALIQASQQFDTKVLHPITRLSDEELITHIHRGVRDTLYLRLLLKHPEYEPPVANNEYGERMVKQSTERLQKLIKGGRGRSRRFLSSLERQTIKNILRDREANEPQRTITRRRRRQDGSDITNEV